MDKEISQTNGQDLQLFVIGINPLSKSELMPEFNLMLIVKMMIVLLVIIKKNARFADPDFCHKEQNV